ncbi:MAG: pirin family protein [Bryobacterales bacterium]
MLEVIKAKDRYTLDAGWLLARWHFSFDHYYDPQNMGFGALRVFNHDVIQPGQGFPMHPHKDMEIVTFLIRGQLEHRDSTGGHGVIRPGEVQYMRAGKGVRHSEVNPSQTEEAELLQMWVLPEKKGLEPAYEQREFAPGPAKGKVAPVMSVNDGSTTFYVAQVEPGKPLTHELSEGRRAYAFVIDGAPTLNGQTLEKNDSVKVTGERFLLLESQSPAEVLFVDLP